VGKTVDNVVDLDVVTYRGTGCGPAAQPEELDRRCEAGGPGAECTGRCGRWPDLTATTWPALSRDLTAASRATTLDQLLPAAGFDVPGAVGSEGTCAVLLGATVALSESPPCGRWPSSVR